MNALLKRLMVLLLCCAATTSRAQGTLQTLSLTGGYSLPVGEFASETFNDSRARIAGAGFYGQLAYTRRLAPRWGLHLSASFNRNTARTRALIEEYVKPYASQYYLPLTIVLPGIDTNYTWAGTSSRWQLGTLLLGPNGYLDFARVQLEGHVKGGLAWIQSPSLQFTGTSPSGTYPAHGEVQSQSTLAFAFGAGASLRIPIVDRLHLQFSADWVAARAELKDVPIFATLGTFPTIEQRRTEKRFVGVVNLGAGLALAF